ncbi:BMP-binding endothelial regulator protein-like isoform 1-T1 [Rhinophrynus dorsalis]
MNNFGTAGILTFLAATLIFVNAQETKTITKCPANMEYGCGSACPKTCANFETSEPCKLSCKIGCHCKKGYVLHSEWPNLCVEEKQCPVCKGDDCTCRTKDRSYDSCGTACPKTCDNWNTVVGCIKICVSGCFCKNRTVSDNGVCVPTSKCD